jgi:ribosomal protein L37AE/L43A
VTGADSIRSRRDFLRRYMPRRYAEVYVEGRPPSKCPHCPNFMNWRRSWRAWRCLGCGHFMCDEDRA